jgi:putative SOS response-associated peptidase YedK
MCGRFTLILDPADLQDQLDLGNIPAEVFPRYNIAPTQPVAVVRDRDEKNIELFRWGLIPAWAKDVSIGNRMINARSETLSEKPSFRAAFARRRCLILADGFFEWQHSSKTHSQPYYFQLEPHKAFAFAGLWESWQPAEGAPLLSCTIITCAANARVAPLHDRMPVILEGERMWDWLSPSALPNDLQSLLVPYPAENMTSYPVSPRVNSPAYNGTDSTVPQNVDSLL